ncbi:MAG: PAS domain S-box protein [Smithellaceae bacterium]
MPRLTERFIETMGAGLSLAQKGKYVFASPTYEKLTGYSAADIIGTPVLAHVHPDDREAVKKNMAKNLKSKNPDPYEYRFIRKNGEILWFLETVGSVVYKGAPTTEACVIDITRYQQKPDGLNRSEERYRTILEEIEEGYGELDLDGNFIFVNQAAARTIGYMPEELLHTNIRSYLSSDQIEKLAGLFNEIYQTGRSVKGMEVAFVTKSGVTRFIEVSGALIQDAAGNPTGFRGITRDVTQRKWSEDALMQSEAKYLSIIESIGQAYFETDLRGAMSFINDKVCIDLGYSRDELLHMSHHNIQDAENTKKTVEAFRQVYNTGITNPAFVYEAIRKDGSRAVFELSVSLMHDADGKPIGFRGLSRDVTERKRMESALKASEARARTIIETIPDPYFETNLKGKITYINKAFQSLSGYSLDELATVNYRNYLEGKDAKAVFTLYNTVYKTGLTMRNMEIEVLTRSGERRMVDLSVSLIRDPQGEATGFHGIMRDVTEKKKAEAIIIDSEQKLRDYSETLERRVAERTAELEKSKVAAEAASRAKSDFLANISHEFQTPLNSIIGFTRVLKDRLFGELNDKQEEFIRYITEAGENLSRLLTEIIDVSNVSTGRTLLRLSPVALPQALSKTIALLDTQIRDKRQLLEVNVAIDADVSIEADDEKIRHIFFHLLSNAVKYTPEGGKITVEAQRSKSLSGEEGVAVAFQDTGCGIKPEDIPRLFQNFGRLESSYTRESSGVGVGLSLTRQLAELHGGSISVESEYGIGSRFIVFLPLQQKHPAHKG